jgi:predicted small secreted protein
MKRKTGAQKKELAIKIVKHLFSNNEKVAGEFIELVLKDVPQVHFFRRNFIKFFNLFAKNE